MTPLRRAHQGTAVVVLAVAVLAAWHALGLRLYTPMGPGAGFFPFWLAVLLAGLAVILLVQATLGLGGPAPDEAVAEPGDGQAGGYRRITVILGALGAVCLLLEPLGFRLTSFLFYLVLLNLLSRPPWVVALLIATAGSFGVYALFTEVLMIRLPVGWLGI